MRSIEPDSEEIDHWLNCNNVPCAIDVGYERVSEFKAAR
jgi:hypothetical protein